MKTTFNVVQDLMLAMNARERTLRGEPALNENLCAWMSAILQAEQHACSDDERALLNQIVDAMEMQDKRQSGEFHLTAEAAEAIWKPARLAAEAYVIGASARRFGYSGLPQQGHTLSVVSSRPQGRKPETSPSAADLFVDDRPMHFPEFHLSQNPWPKGGTDFPKIEVESALTKSVTRALEQTGGPKTILFVTDGDVPQDPPPLANRKSDVPEGEVFLKQRAETLARALRRFGVELKHGQALTVVAQMEGHTAFQALKVALPRHAPCFCPHCGAAATLEEVDTVFCEQGEYDGKSYEAEGEGKQYQCSRCRGQFLDWDGLPPKGEGPAEPALSPKDAAWWNKEGRDGLTPLTFVSMADIQEGKWPPREPVSSADPLGYVKSLAEKLNGDSDEYEVLTFDSGAKLFANQGTRVDHSMNVEEAKASARKWLQKDTCFAVRVQNARTKEEIKF